MHVDTVADWVGCLVLGFTSIGLGSKIYGFKPAGKHVLYFFGTLTFVLPGPLCRSCSRMRAQQQDKAFPATLPCEGDSPERFGRL